MRHRAFPAFGTDEPVRPHGHVLDVAIGLACALDHPADVILIIDLDVSPVAVAQRRKALLHPFVHGLGPNAFLGGKLLGAVLAQVGLCEPGLLTACNDAEERTIVNQALVPHDGNVFGKCAIDRLCHFLDFGNEFRLGLEFVGKLLFRLLH